MFYMRHIIFISVLWLSFCVPLFSQYQSIVVTYAIDIKKDGSTAAPPNGAENVLSKVRDIGFTLKCSSTESIFYPINKSGSDDFESWMVNRVASSDKKYYLNKVSQQQILEEQARIDIIHIKDKLPTYKWKITRDTMHFLGYIAYRAIATIDDAQVMSGQQKPSYEAWFLPDINYPFGPIGVHGLPGLIVQLVGGQRVFRAVKIEFSTSKLACLEYLSKPTKVMTQAEYEKAY